MPTSREIEENIERWSDLVDRAREQLDDAQGELDSWMAKTPDA